MGTYLCKPYWPGRSAAGSLEHKDSVRFQQPPHAGAKTPPRSFCDLCSSLGRPCWSPRAGAPCSCPRRCSGRGWTLRWTRASFVGSELHLSVWRLSSQPPEKRGQHSAREGWVEPSQVGEPDWDEPHLAGVEAATGLLPALLPGLLLLLAV